MNIFQILLVQPMANGLVLFYRVLGGNLGLAIIGFSVFLRLILHPLTRSSIENAKKMAELKPQIDKLKEKYKNDKQKLLQAQSDFYKSKGFNPGAGCLPQILQIVVLYALFAVFNGVLHGNSIENFNNLLYSPLKFDAAHSLQTSFLYLDLVKPDSIQLDFLPFAIPGPLLILAAVSQAISAKIMTPYIKEEEKAAKKTKDQTDDMQVMMQKYSVTMFPLMTLLVGMQFPSGLALYWVVFSLLQTYQQYRVSGWGGITPWVKRLGI